MNALLTALVTGLLVDACTGLKIWPKPAHVSVAPDEAGCRIAAGFSFKSELVAGPFVDLLTQFARDATAKMTILTTAGAGLATSTELCIVTSCALRVDDPLGTIGLNTESEAHAIDFRDVGECSITCKTVFGCMHGMRSFLQIVDPIYGLAVPVAFSISDEPAFSHRALMLDTGSHFLPTDLILETIEMMSETKLNVLHWHISEHQSFPMESRVYPKLSGKGAFSPKAVYSQADVRTIVAFARARGIRVIPELDVPAHTTSWFRGYPELLGSTTWAIDLTREDNYVFLEKLLVETRALFATDIHEEEAMIHLGGDETENCWETPEINAWMEARGMSGKGDLVQYWVSRLTAMATKIDIRITLWADFLMDTIDGFGDESNRIVWQTWQHSEASSAMLAAVLQRDVIHSQGFYLDHTYETWMDFYGRPLKPAPGLIGGETCLWTAWADETNAFMETWPRAAAAAERFWRGDKGSLKAKYGAALRLAKWRCRMVHLFGHPGVGPVGDTGSDTIENPWVTSLTGASESFWIDAANADKTQFWCPEADLGTPWAVVRAPVWTSSTPSWNLLMSIIPVLIILN